VTANSIHTLISRLNLLFPALASEAGYEDGNSMEMMYNMFDSTVFQLTVQPTQTLQLPLTSVIAATITSDTEQGLSPVPAAVVAIESTGSDEGWVMVTEGTDSRDHDGQSR
jgi:hypothetical protein